MTNTQSSSIDILLEQQGVASEDVTPQDKQRLEDDINHGMKNQAM